MTPNKKINRFWDNLKGRDMIPIRTTCVENRVPAETNTMPILNPKIFWKALITLMLLLTFIC